ncbi:MAG: hypothetical protein SNJ55_01640 [Chloroherpetonaceae bacterium]
MLSFLVKSGVKSVVLFCLLNLATLLSRAEALAQSAPQSSPEKGVVCIYFKRLNPSNPTEGVLMQLVNKSTTSGRFILRTSPDANKAVYVDIGRDVKPNERDVIERNLATRIGDMFSAKSEKSVKSVAQYKDLLKLILDSEQRVFQQIDLTKNFDIRDTVYVFDFDAATQNYSIFKNDGRPEALALYQFVDERWTGKKFYPDYKSRLSKHDFKDFLEPEILEAIFQTRKAPQEQAELNPAQKRTISDADQKATWALILSVISIIIGVFGLLTNAMQGKDKVDQLGRIEGKVKTLENRLNKPFYQTDVNAEEESRRGAQQLQSLVARVIALERAAGVKVTDGISGAVSFKNETAAALQKLIQQYREKWSEEPSLAGVYGQLTLCLDDFTVRLSELENGLLMKDFVIKYVMPHIDALDSLFQPEPDAPINTPEIVNEYLRALQKMLTITEIEVRAKISRFDNERHEKAGAILKTNLESGTITKVLRRGLIHGETVRKAQVIRAE